MFSVFDSTLAYSWYFPLIAELNVYISQQTMNKEYASMQPAHGQMHAVVRTSYNLLSGGSLSAIADLHAACRRTCVNSNLENMLRLTNVNG